MLGRTANKMRKHGNHQATVLGMKNSRGLSRLFLMSPSVCEIAWGWVGGGGGEQSQ